MNIKKIVGVSFGLVATEMGIYKLLSGNEPKKYSSKWFETLSDEMMDNEREIVRKRYCSSGDDFALAVSLENLLRRFDSVLNKRAWGDEIPQGPSYHREHENNLFKEN